MPLIDDLERLATLAAAHAAPGETLAAVLASEPLNGTRAYLCAYEDEDGRRSWLTLDAAGAPIENRAAVRDAASIAALCEVAVEVAGGGDLAELRTQLVALRLRENPPGVEEAEEAALALERVVGAPPRVARPALLDEVGAATRRLEVALGQAAGSPFAEAMKQSIHAVDALAEDVEANYKRTLT